MSSQFFGLYIAQSGLNAFQAAINTTANNISNVETEGYSRQKVELKATSALRAFQKYGSVSTGVTPEQVVQLRDKYYDQKYWQNQSSYGYYTTMSYNMDQIENYFTDSAANKGFTTIFTSMFNSLDAIKSSPSDSTVRAQFVNDAEKLSRYFNNTSTLLSDLQTSLNDEIKAQVDEINSIAQKIATLNKQINTLEISKSNANELRDDRAALLDRLSEICTIEVEEDVVEDPNFPDHDTGLHIFNVKINGQSLVNTGEYYKLTVDTRSEKKNLMDVDGLYEIKWETTGNSVKMTGNSQTGSLRALFELRDGNDEGNMRGRVTNVSDDGKKITIEDPSYTDVNALNMPSKGYVNIKGLEYEYSSFDVQMLTDEQGNIVVDPLTGQAQIKSVTFNLPGVVTADEKAKVTGAQLAVGDTVDCKGIPYYQNEMNKFLRSFSKAFNDIEHRAEDLYGNMGSSFFIANDTIDGHEHLFTDGTLLRQDDPKYDAALFKTTFSSSDDTYYQMTAANIYVNSAVHNDLKLLATAVYKPDEQGVDDSTVIDQLARLQKDVVIYRGGGASTFLESIYSDVTVDTREANMFEDYFTNIQKSIDKQRKSVSGVDEDEEAQNLVKFQNAYNLSSKVISVLAEMYDQLILNTGV